MIKPFAAIGSSLALKLIGATARAAPAAQIGVLMVLPGNRLALIETVALGIMADAKVYSSLVEGDQSVVANHFGTLSDPVL